MSTPTTTPTTTTTKTVNPLRELAKYGQSVWLDYIRRNLITSGELKRLIDDDGLGGVTSNPAIFEKAITGSTDYADALLELQKRKDLDAMGIYEILAIKDIQDAADALRVVYDRTKKRDGYVSLEVSPFLARDTQGTIKDARRLWKAVNRPNLLVKIPATAEGIPAIQQCISEGININVTLLFAQEMYEKVAHAYIAGVKTYVAGGGDSSHVASVASFFISRIDSMVDAIVKARLKSTSDPKEQALLRSLLGKVAIANGKLTYQRYKEIFAEAEWNELAKKGGQTQRVLWASTSTKDPSYPDVLYIEELIGPETVNTIPPQTLEAFRDHGKPKASLEADIDAAHDTMDTLEKVGISMKKVTDDLVTQAVKLFAEPFDKLLNTVDAKCKYASQAEVDAQTYTLPDPINQQLTEAIDDWKMAGKVRRLWARDASLWTGTDESNWMGWLGITEDQLAHKQHLEDIAKDVKSAGFKNALLLGMGGSSLCPEVFKMTFGKIDGHPELFVLDSTDPAQVKAFESKVDIANTIFIVSSKSGSTLEPNIFKQYFFERVKQVVGADKAGSRFIAITDPGSKFEQVAQADAFRHIFHGVPSIGGRYSALSDFGMVPAAVMGIDAPKFLDRADVMAIACSSCLPVEKNPGVLLGLILGIAAKNKRDKVTLIASPGISDFGAWLEQLLAESTGKDGKGLIPVDREALGAPEVYGNDRVFAYIRLENGADVAQDKAVDAIAKAGHPVIRIALADTYNLGQEMFRWEIATAVAGSVIGINPFNQPDVEASKIATRKLTAEYEKTGSLPPESPIWSEDSIQLFTDEKNAAALASAVGSDKSLVGYLRAHLKRLGTGDYFALLAYVQMNEPHERTLQGMRIAIRDKRRAATCLGFGPRFLHSTGQAYKGGPNSGVFLQVTCDDKNDLPVPGQKFTFGVVKAAQARGDFQVLAERNRRALRVHLKDVDKGLTALESAIKLALS
ncbi:MAG TPA: bifunctional transaldolase/phosoglucose isomerase [Bryobacteraceae bacterium]|jgi:transaldolase/glucose-6-phosphate isomerase|nr:bifunctional transaldolase/phosoglucose isomerase [Bryobacteraceae bacterium]